MHTQWPMLPKVSISNNIYFFNLTSILQSLGLLNLLFFGKTTNKIENITSLLFLKYYLCTRLSVNNYDAYVRSLTLYRTKIFKIWSATQFNVVKILNYSIFQDCIGCIQITIIILLNHVEHGIYWSVKVINISIKNCSHGEATVMQSST